MLTFVISLFGILITIFFVIGTHEYAHFLVARLLNIKILRFSIGFGKTIWHWHDKKGTEFVIALIPLGGYVKMLDEHEGKVPDAQLPFAFNRQPFYKKFLVVAAGPLTNLCCAFILYWIIFVVGFATILPIIDHIVPGSIAAHSGLKANQEIVRVNNKNTFNWMRVVVSLITEAGNKNPIKLEVKNLADKILETHYVDLSNWHIDGLTPNPLLSIGIVPDSKRMRQFIHQIQFGPVAAIPHAYHETIDLLYFNLVLVGKMIKGTISLQSLGGPITIFESAGSALSFGLLPFISFLAFLSIAIGMINLLPIPGLDGGHLVIYFIEFIIRKPLPLAFLFALYRLGFGLVLFILIHALINDLLRLSS